jgi:hypothetical protein
LVWRSIEAYQVIAGVSDIQSAAVRGYVYVARAPEPGNASKAIRTARLLIASNCNRISHRGAIRQYRDRLDLMIVFVHYVQTIRRFPEYETLPV